MRTLHEVNVLPYKGEESFKLEVNETQSFVAESVVKDTSLLTGCNDGVGSGVNVPRFRGAATASGTFCARRRCPFSLSRLALMNVCFAGWPGLLSNSFPTYVPPMAGIPQVLA